VTADELDFVFSDRKPGLNRLAAGATKPLYRVLAKLALADLPVALKHAAIANRNHPLSLLNEDVGAEAFTGDRAFIQGS